MAGNQGAFARGHTERYLIFQGRTNRFAVASTRVLRVCSLGEVDASLTHDLRALLDLDPDPEAARVLQLDVANERRHFLVGAPLEFIRHGQCVEMPALLRSRGAGRFISAVLVDEAGPGLLVLDPDSLARFASGASGATKEETP
jgi:hypothetical protein